MWNLFKPHIEHIPIRLHDLEKYEPKTTHFIGELPDQSITPDQIVRELSRALTQEEAAYGLFKRSEFGFQEPLHFFGTPVSWKQLHTITEALKDWTDQVHTPEKRPQNLKKIMYIPSPARRLADRLANISIGIYHARARRQTRMKIRQELLKFVGAHHQSDGHVDHMYHAPARPLKDAEKSQYGPPKAHEAVLYYLHQRHDANDVGFKTSFIEHILDPTHLYDQQQTDLKRLESLQDHLTEYQIGLQQAQERAKRAPVSLSIVRGQIENEIKNAIKWRKAANELRKKLIQQMNIP